MIERKNEDKKVSSISQEELREKVIKFINFSSGSTLASHFSM
jgi:hypothetical protein